MSDEAALTETQTGDVISAGDFILISFGAYSQYGVSGLYQCEEGFTVPGVDKARWELIEQKCRKVAVKEIWCGE